MCDVWDVSGDVYTDFAPPAVTARARDTKWVKGRTNNRRVPAQGGSSIVTFTQTLLERASRRYAGLKARLIDALMRNE